MRRLGGLAAVNLRHLKDHPGRTTLSLIGIASGSALVVAMLGLVGSLTSGVDRLVASVGDVDLQVTAPGGAPLPEDLATRVGAVPGVATAAPIVRTSVVVAGEHVLLLGADESAQTLTASLNAKCVRPSGAAVADGRVPVAVGPALARHIRTHEQETRAALYNGSIGVPIQAAATITCGDLSRLNNGWFVAAPLPAAEALAGRPGKPDAVLVRAAPGTTTRDLTTRVEAAAGPGVIVASPRQALREASKEAEIFQQGSMFVVSLALIVGGFLVFNTVSMAALERRRELATLRALGARRRTVAAVVLAEASVLGVMGATIGAAVGVFAGRAAINSVPPVLVTAVGVRPAFTIAPWQLVLGIAVGTAATVVAAFIPARSVSRVPPVDAMRPEGVLEAGDNPGVRPLPLAGGIAALGVGYLLCAAGEQAALIAGFALVNVGFILATVGLMGPIASWVAVTAGRFGSVGRLAGAGLERSPRRVWATTVAVLVGVGAVVTFRASIQNELDTFSRSIASLGRPDLVLTTARAEDFPSEVSMSRDWAQRVATVPGVAKVRAGQAFYATVDGTRVILEGTQDPPTIPLVAMLSAKARADIIAGRAISISRTFALAKGLKVGDVYELPTASGPQRLPVAGVVNVLMPVPGGGVAMALDRLEQWYGRPGSGWLEIYTTPGSDPATVRSRVTALAGTAPFPTFVYSGAELLSGARRSVRQSAGIFLSMQWVVVGATALAVLNTLLISVIERRRELGILRAIGTSRRRVRRMVATEALAIGAVGGALGLLFGLSGHYVAVLGFTRLVGYRVRYELLAFPLVVAAVAAAVIAVLASLAPAWRAARVNVVEAIGYE
jgi:putative ABC transport system permease protein